MTEIYKEIAKLTDKFRTMTYGLTKDENKVNEAVQELMLYFLSMDPSTLKVYLGKRRRKRNNKIRCSCIKKGINKYKK